MWTLENRSPEHEEAKKKYLLLMPFRIKCNINIKISQQNHALNIIEVKLIDLSRHFSVA